MNPPLYSKEAFAALVGVPVETVVFWMRSGAVQTIRLGKIRVVRFPGVSQ